MNENSARPIEDIYPLAPTQEGLLFHALASPEAGLYFEQSSMRLDGVVDIEAMQAAWQQLVDQHAVLRTGFDWQELDRPVQIVHRSVKVPFERLDWSGRSEAQQLAALDEYLLADRRKGFDLSRPPLLRVAVAAAGSATNYLVWSHHHIILDGWSRTRLLTEVLERYRAVVEGDTPRVERARPYRDFIQWLERRPREASLSYWRQTLGDVTSATRLGVERRHRGQAEADEGVAEERLVASRELTRALESFTRAQRVTIAVVLQGVWAMLMGRYAGSDDVVFGYTVSGRPASLPGVESMIGLMVNAVPVRVHVDNEARVSDWLQELQRRQFERGEHEHLALVEVQGCSGVRSPERLFESLLVHENYPRAGGGTSSRLAVSTRGYRVYERTGYPLTVESALVGDLHIKITYERGSYAGEAVRTLLEHFEVLLARVVASPEARLGELGLLGEEARRLVVEEWNATASEYPREATLWELFERRAEAHPQGEALRCGGQVLSYGELCRRARAVAARLRAAGTVRGSRVGVLSGRTADYVVGVLGVLAAGGVWVSLEPGYPAQRLAFMAEDAGLATVLSTAALRERVPGSVSGVVLIEEAQAGEPAVAGGGPEPRVEASDPAYVIYTSGSTGRPKGVVGTHRGVVNRLWWMYSAYPYAADERCCHKTTVGFVDAVAELFGPLLGGVPLEFLDEASSADPHALVEAVRARGVTRLLVVPSLLRAVLELDEAALRALPVRLWVSSGERLEAELERRFYERFPQSVLLNLYGSSEVSADVTCFDTRERGERVGALIGRPIANTRLYVLDGAGQPVPAGVPGELYVGGDGLAAGYLGQPELTAERFLADPFVAGERLYRTGDRVRYAPDGVLEYLGRMDQQVKVRGQRVELGEVEATLAGHPQVAQAAVLWREGGDGEGRLEAYVTSAADAATPERGALRAYLAERLPGYMVPAAIALLDTMPLTASGKVDRRALEPLDEDQGLERLAYEPPREGVECELAALWSELLRVERVGAREDFFALGGHSLTATRLLARVSDRFGVHIALADFFAAPTVRGLAELVESTLWLEEQRAPLDDDASEREVGEL